MKEDPVIDRVRKARHDISVQFGHDPEKLVAYYMERQQRHADRLIEEQRREQDQSETGLS